MEEEDASSMSDEEDVMQHLCMLSAASEGGKHSPRKQAKRHRDANSAACPRTKISAAGPGLGNICTQAVDRRSKCILKSLKAPRAAKIPKPAYAASCKDGRGEALRRAKNSYLATKSCITRSVFLGMIKMADEDPKKFPLISIVPCPELDSDGVVFLVRDFPKVASAVFHAWMLLNLQPATLEKQLEAVQKFLNRDADAMLLLEEDGIKNSSCGWENFKISLDDADVVPIDLMCTRMRLAGKVVPDAVQGLCEGKAKASKRMGFEWHRCRHWFVPHLLRTVVDGGKLRDVVQRFTGWGLIDYVPVAKKDDAAARVAPESSEESSNNIETDVFFCVGGAAAAAVDNSKEEMTNAQRKVKKEATPFHALVVDAARAAIGMALSENGV